jgi:hypothetical protein
MGNLKVGDKIIITDVLQLGGKSLDHLNFTIQEISSIHTPEDYYPYRIEVGNSTHWVAGIPYSSLVVELL